MRKEEACKGNRSVHKRVMFLSEAMREVKELFEIADYECK